jgi:ABC-type multidrug transport system fused ATPase/permease subunit
MINLIIKLYSFFSSKEKKTLIWLILLLITGMILEMIGVALVFPVISILQNNKNSQNENFLIKNLNLDIGNENNISMSLLVLVIFYLVKTFYVFFLTWKQNTFVSKLTFNLSKNFFKHYILQDYKFHLNTNSSFIIRNIRDEPEAISNILLALFGFITESSIIIGIGFLLMLFEPAGTLYLILFFSLCILIFQKIVKKRLQIWGKKRQFYNSKRSQYLSEGFGAIKDIKILRKEQFFNERFNVENHQYNYFNRMYLILNQLPRIYLEFLSVLGLSVLIFILTLSNDSYLKVLPVIGVFVAAAFRMLPSVNRIMSSLQTFKYFESSLDILYEEKKQLKDLYFDEFQSDSYSLTSKISINNLDFRYDENSKNILNNFNLTISKGDYIGIIGSSGSGKSTLIDIILGLIMPISGNVKIDEIELKTNSSNWKKLIGYVPQTIFLTDDTVINNIALGVEPSDIDMSQINRIIKETQLDNFIDNLEYGLYTTVGERGIRLSGGQRQRIGIARALYNNPEVLILDEATSALDSDTESLILNELLQYKRNKTIIVIAHRLSTLSNCDKVIEISNGVIIKSGSPKLFLN